MGGARGWVRTADRILQLSPSQPQPILPVFQRAQLSAMEGRVILVWSRVEDEDTVSPCPCGGDEVPESSDVAYCSLCPRECAFGGHSRALKGLVLCNPCLLRLGGPSTQPYCVQCSQPLGDAGSIGCATCGLRTHARAECSSHQFEVRQPDFITCCHRLACQPLAYPRDLENARCMGCAQHLTLSLGSLPCTGSCGRSWCLNRECRPRHPLCRRCSMAATSLSSNSGFEKQTNARSGASV